ncbi:MAG: DinB family protein [Cyclobacteriaceae bacterium]
MKLEQWTQEIDDATAAFKKYFGGLSNEELNWKPSPDAWSIAQNIDHLITINQTYFKVIADIRNGTYQVPFISKFGFVVSLFGNMIYNASKPDRKKKITTFQIWQPSDSPDPSDILARFEAHHEELKQIISSSMDLVEEGIVISSPANKNIVYKLEKAFDIIIIHEQRHLEQAKEVLGLLNANKASATI